MAGKRDLFNHHEIGISVYPDFMSLEEIKIRLKRAAQLGYTRVFTSIQLSDLGFENGSDSKEDFIELFKLCHELGMIAHIDINKAVFEDWGASVSNLKPLADLHMPVLRLDGGFTLEETIQLTKNPYGIMIEDNAANEAVLLENMEAVCESGNSSQYRACHNFFPRNETGIDFDKSVQTAQLCLDKGIQCASFIGDYLSPNDLNASGQGVCTVERHRYLPSSVAYQEFRAANVFDIILFGDSDPSLEQLEKVAALHKAKHLQLEAWLDSDLDKQVRKHILSTPLTSRADQPQDLIRCTQTRKALGIQAKNNHHRPKGTVTIDNIRSNRYEGELQFTLKDLGPSPVANVIGMIKPPYLNLLEMLVEGRYPFTLAE